MGNVDLICRLHRGVDTKLRNHPDLLVGAAYMMVLKEIAPDIYDNCPKYINCESSPQKLALKHLSNGNILATHAAIIKVLPIKVVTSPDFR